MRKNWEKVSWKIKRNKSKFYESNLLKLNSLKAKKKLKWKSVLTFKETSKLTSLWYKEYYLKKGSIEMLSIKHLQYFQKILNERL